MVKPLEELIKEKRIGQIINDRLVQAAPDISLKSAVALMQRNKSGYVVIAEGKKVTGIFTETDVARKVLEKKVNWDAPVKDFMTHDPVVLSARDSVGKAIDVMGRGRIYHIPLVDENDALSGVISVRTLIRFLAEFYPAEIFNLPPNPAQIMETPEGG
jgi:CBS domain-containing protein